MFHINDGDQQKNRHIDTDQQHMPGKAVTVVEKSENCRRCQLNQYASQWQGRAAFGTASPIQQISCRRQPSHWSASHITVCAVRQSQVCFVRQRVGQRVYHTAHQ